MEVAGSDLLLWRLLSWVFSFRGHWLGRVPMDIPDSDLSLPWFGSNPTEISGLGLLPWWLLPHICSCRGHLLWSALAEVACLDLFLLRLLAQTWFQGGDWLGPAPRKVTGSSLFLKRSVAWAVLTEVAGSSLLPQRSLAGACSC